MAAVIQFPSSPMPTVSNEGTRVVADLDDGFVRIAGAIQKAKCKLRMAGREFCVLEAVIACTYGWNKKEDWVTNTYLAEMCEMDPSDVSKALAELARRQIIHLEKRGYMKIVSVNKVVSEWISARATSKGVAQNTTKKETQKGLGDFAKSLGENTQKVGRFHRSELAKTPSTKDSLTKDNKNLSSSQNANALFDQHGDLLCAAEPVAAQRVVAEPVAVAADDAARVMPEAAVQTPSGKFWGTEADLTCAQYIHSRVLVVNPTAKAPNWSQWANECRLMREQDGRSHREICELFKWANLDPFWSANVLCPKTLRKQWDKLAAKRLQPVSGKSGSRQVEPPMPRLFGEERPAAVPVTSPASQGGRPKLFGE